MHPVSCPTSASFAAGANARQDDDLENPCEEVRYEHGAEHAPFTVLGIVVHVLHAPAEGHDQAHDAAGERAGREACFATHSVVVVGGLDLKTGTGAGKGCFRQCHGSNSHPHVSCGGE